MLFFGMSGGIYGGYLVLFFWGGEGEYFDKMKS